MVESLHGYAHFTEWLRVANLVLSSLTFNFHSKQYHTLGPK